MLLVHFVEVSDPKRIEGGPDKTEVLLGSGRFAERGFVISRVELRLYKEGADQKLGPYSLITSFVGTDRGSIEITYDEGYRGEMALERTAKFVSSELGLSALVLRALIALDAQIRHR